MDRPFHAGFFSGVYVDRPGGGITCAGTPFQTRRAASKFKFDPELLSVSVAIADNGCKDNLIALHREARGREADERLLGGFNSRLIRADLPLRGYPHYMRFPAGKI